MVTSVRRIRDIRPQGYKTFSMLNSVAHKILNAHKYKKYQEIRLFRLIRQIFLCIRCRNPIMQQSSDTAYQSSG